jgi:single-strand DNA-binding protein
MVSPVLVGVPRFELGTSPTRTERATRLRHTPSAAYRLATLSARIGDVSPATVASDENKGGSVNSVILIGNLATDIELKDVAPDKKVASFLLAVDRPGKDAGADFVHVATWNRQAEVCDEYLSKGSKIAVDGRLRSRSWEDEDGKRRSAIEVVANRVQFLDARSRDENPFDQLAPA